MISPATVAWAVLSAGGYFVGRMEAADDPSCGRSTLEAITSKAAASASFCQQASGRCEQHQQGCDVMKTDDLSQMIFAEVDYPGDHWDEHKRMVALIESFFPNTQSGVQGDSWIWITDGGNKVAIDTFSSMKHQVKSKAAGPHIQKVIEALRTKYDVKVFEEPVREWD